MYMSFKIVKIVLSYLYISDLIAGEACNGKFNLPNYSRTKDMSYPIEWKIRRYSQMKSQKLVRTMLRCNTYIVKGDIPWNSNDTSQFCLMLQKSHQFPILNLLNINLIIIISKISK